MDGEDLTTTLDAGDADVGAVGAGQTPIAEPSVRDDVAAAFREIEDKAGQAEGDGKDGEAGAETKGEKEEKEPPAKDAKAEKPKAEEKKEGESDPKDQDDAGEDQEGKEGKKTPDARDRQPGQSEYMEPPKGILPEAIEKWGNTPRSVRAEVHRLVTEAETQINELRESTQRYDQLRVFDETARGNGVDLVESLNRVVQLENMMEANPIAGLNAVLMQAGPRKADGQPYSLYEIAQHIVGKGPEGYARMVQPPRQQDQSQGQMAALAQENKALRAQAQIAPIVAQFKAEHPRFDELGTAIAGFLKSGMIPASLPEPERLAAAYDMAERLYPSSHHAGRSSDDGGLAPNSRADDGLGGKPKSIKSSPGSVTDEVELEAAPDESVLDSIRAVVRRAR